MTHVVELGGIQKLAKQFRAKGKKIVVAGGCFDLLHIGHITLLENAKKQGDTLIVFLESDASIKKRKGINRPIHTQAERAKLLSALRAVDVIVLLQADMQNNDYDKLIQDIQPTVIAMTENDNNQEQRKKQAGMVGARLIAVNKYIPSVSTTKLLQILEEEI